MKNALTAFATLAFFAPAAVAADIEFKDPAGDDKGPGTYVYPTDSVYAPKSFDMRSVSLKDKGSTVDVKVTFGAKIDDPWGSTKWDGNGFSLQMVFIFIDQDHKAGSGHKDAIPGLNVTFKEESRWEKALIISPQGNKRLETEINAKARSMKKDIVLPKKVRVQGRSLVATFDKAEIGGLETAWGYQALVQSNEGFPVGNDLLTRPVNEEKGKDRFGGGSDFSCDPHVMDMLAGRGTGDAGEAKAQYAALSYKCSDEDPEAGTQAEIPMIYPGN